jgi:hypothetical protein
MTLVLIEAWVENAACKMVAVAWLFLVVFNSIYTLLFIYFKIHFRETNLTSGFILFENNI